MIPFKINYHWYRARTVCCSKLHSTLKFRDVLAPGTHLGLVILHSPGPVDILVIPTILSGIPTRSDIIYIYIHGNYILTTSKYTNLLYGDITNHSYP